MTENKDYAVACILRDDKYEILTVEQVEANSFDEAKGKAITRAMEDNKGAKLISFNLIKLV